MKKHFYLLATCLLMLTSAIAFSQAQTWKIADGYSIKFDGGDPSGQFTGLKGTIQFDENNLPASKFDVTVDATSINTGNGMKNTHAKGAAWFDVEKYPNIIFTSSSITKTAAGYDAKGTLEIKGVKKDFTMPFTFANNTFVSNFEIVRADFGIDDGKHPKMAPNMKVSLSVPVTK